MPSWRRSAPCRAPRRGHSTGSPTPPPRPRGSPCTGPATESHCGQRTSVGRPGQPARPGRNRAMPDSEQERSLPAVAVLAIASNESQLRGAFYRILADIHGSVAGTGSGSQSGLLGKLDDLLSLRSSTLHLIAAALAAYALLEAVEAVGLWYQRR